MAQKAAYALFLVEWSGYFLTEPLLRWLLPSLWVASAAYHLWHDTRPFEAAGLGLIVSIAVASVIAIPGWVIRWTGKKLRHLLMRWAEDWAVEVHNYTSP